MNVPPDFFDDMRKLYMGIDIIYFAWEVFEKLLNQLD